HGPCDPTGGGGDGGGGDGNGGGDGGPCSGNCGEPGPRAMAGSRVHLMLVSLNIIDEPLRYSPPVGLPVGFTGRYNQRDAFQAATFTYSNLGPKWTFDWLSYLTDTPQNPLADVNYYIMGGGTRTFTDFDNVTQSYAFQQYDQTKLTRTSP